MHINLLSSVIDASIIHLQILLDAVVISHSRWWSCLWIQESVFGTPVVKYLYCPFPILATVSFFPATLLDVFTSSIHCACFCNLFEYGLCIALLLEFDCTDLASFQFRYLIFLSLYASLSTFQDRSNSQFFVAASICYWGEWSGHWSYHLHHHWRQEWRTEAGGLLWNWRIS